MPNTSSPELLGSGKGTKRRPNRESAPLRTTRVPEPEWPGPGKYRQPRAGHGWFPAEQPRAWAAWAERLHAPWTGGRPSVAEALRAHTSVICLQHPSLPPLSATEQVSLKKKKSVLHRPLCVRVKTRHWRDQQTEESITEGTTLEAIGNRLKPGGYYQLHRKGPIDLEKYKSDEGTSQKWTEPTILTTKPEKVLDIFLLFLWLFFLSFYFILFF